MTAQAQSYSVLLSAFLHPLAGVVPQGYALTRSADGTGYVVATTANLALSVSGTVDYIALSAGNAYDNIQAQNDGEVHAAIVPWIGP